MLVRHGVLVISGQRTKKWKYMFFVLNGTEQQLYYFENQKVKVHNEYVCIGDGDNKNEYVGDGDNKNEYVGDGDNKDDTDVNGIIFPGMSKAICKAVLGILNSCFKCDSRDRSPKV